MMKLMLVITMISFLSACSNNNKTVEANKSESKMITGAKAIELASKFVVEQGYTLNTPSSNKGFKFEKGEFATDTAKILSYRKNTLLRKPLGAKQHGNSWSVGFEYVNKENNIGRAVTIDALGENIIMQPKEVRLDWFFEVEKAE